MEYISKKEEETEQIARDFVNDFVLRTKNRDKAFVVGLYGDLGAGKTTFMKYLAKHLGVTETIQSPTFVIMKIYKLKAKSYELLFHIDAYRIEKDEEMLKLGWEDIISNSQNIVFVEWPELIKNIMPAHTKIFFEHLSENERKIKITQ